MDQARSRRFQAERFAWRYWFLRNTKSNVLYLHYVADAKNRQLRQSCCWFGRSEENSRSAYSSELLTATPTHSARCEYEIVVVFTKRDGLRGAMVRAVQSKAPVVFEELDGPLTGSGGPVHLRGDRGSGGKKRSQSGEFPCNLR